MSPFFSIIIPTYNRADTLQRALRSVLAQNFEDWELIIIDDGSTDNTREKVSEITDRRLRYFHKPNEERSIARNFGIEKARGRFICFLDSDDAFLPDHLREIHNKIKERNFLEGFYHTGVRVKSDLTEREETWFYNMSSPTILRSILQNKSLYPSAVCIPRKILEENKFPPQFNYWEDHHLWIRILLLAPFISVNSVTTCWMVGPDSSVRTFFKRGDLKALEDYLACITDVQNNSEVKNSFLAKYFETYKAGKARMFFQRAIERNRNLVSLKQFVLSLKYLSFWTVFKIFAGEHIKKRF